MGKNAKLETVEAQDKNVAQMDAHPQLTRNLKRHLATLLEIVTLMHQFVIGGTQVALMDSPFHTRWMFLGAAKSMAMEVQTLTVQGSSCLIVPRVHTCRVWETRISG